MKFINPQNVINLKYFIAVEFCCKSEEVSMNISCSDNISQSSWKIIHEFKSQNYNSGDIIARACVRVLNLNLIDVSWIVV